MRNNGRGREGKRENTELGNEREEAEEEEESRKGLGFVELRLVGCE